MASKNKIRVGDVWADSKGRRLKVTGGLDSRNKIPLLNLSTNRPINSKGPRALVRLVSQGEGPKITRVAANPAGPFPAMPATRPPARRRRASPKAPPMVPRGRASRPRRPLAASASTPPLEFGPRIPTSANPGSYPSELTKAVAQAMAGMPTAHANDPAAVRAAALTAIANASGAARRRPPSRPPSSHHGYDEALNYAMGLPLANPPMVPPVVGYSGQYGGYLDDHAPEPFVREDFPHANPPYPPVVGYPGQYGLGDTAPNPGYGFGYDY